MKRLYILCGIMMVALLAGCSSRDTQESPVPEESSGQEETVPEPVEEPAPVREVDAPPAQLVEPGQITVYISEQDSDLVTPVEVSVGDTQDATMMLYVVTVENVLDVQVPVRAITQNKGMVVVDLEASFLEDYSKAQVYRILTTLALTLQQNHLGFEWIQYQLEGEVGVFGQQYEIPPLKLLENDPKEFAAIRAQIPYEGLRYYPIENHIVETDETGKDLANYLFLLEISGREINSIDEIKPTEMLANAIYATHFYTTYQDDQAYREELKPFEAPSSELLGFLEQQFWLQEHVEESIKLLYGQGANVPHQDAGHFRYLELLGVYTPPHMGGGGRSIPVIFSYEDLGDRIQAEVTYYVEGMGGYMEPDTWDEIPEGTLLDYVNERAPRYTVVVEKVGDGWFLLESQTAKD